MARIKTSAFITDIRGKVAGSTFQNTQGGLIVKNSPNPVNKNSLAQNTTRAIAFVNQQAWSLLADAQRLHWNQWVTFANQTQKHNSDRFITGQTAYLKINTYRLLQGYSAMITPFFSTFQASVIEVIPTLSGGLITLNFTPDTNAAAQIMIVFMTFTVRNSLNNPGSRLKLIPFTTPTGSSIDITTTYKNIFGATPASGSKVFIRYATMDQTTGMISSFVQKAFVLIG